MSHAQRWREATAMTLLEVLIALVIAVIAVMAMLKLIHHMELQHWEAEAREDADRTMSILASRIKFTFADRAATTPVNDYDLGVTFPASDCTSVTFTDTTLNPPVPVTHVMCKSLQMDAFFGQAGVQKTITIESKCVTAANRFASFDYTGMGAPCAPCSPGQQSVVVITEGAASPVTLPFDPANGGPTAVRMASGASACFLLKKPPCTTSIGNCPTACTTSTCLTRYDSVQVNLQVGHVSPSLGSMTSTGDTLYLPLSSP